MVNVGVSEPRRAFLGWVTCPTVLRNQDIPDGHWVTIPTGSNNMVVKIHVFACATGFSNCTAGFNKSQIIVLLSQTRETLGLSHYQLHKPTSSYPAPKPTSYHHYKKQDLKLSLLQCSHLKSRGITACVSLYV
jgi:hypothetical protein